MTTIATDLFPDLGTGISPDGLPPPEWFTTPPSGWDPVHDTNAPLVRVTFSGRERGRFAALVAPFDACLLDGKEATGCFPTPRSVDGYGYSHVGATHLADGTILKTANIGGGINHADPRWRSHDQVLDRYANTASRIAAVRYLESDELGGIIALGYVVSGVTAAQGLEAMQSALSGDWRLVRELGGYRFIGSQLVNVPGFRPWQLGDKMRAVTASVARPIIVQSLEVITAAACGCLDELPATLTIEWTVDTPLRVPNPTLRERGRLFAARKVAVTAHPGHPDQSVHAGRSFSTPEAGKAFLQEHYAGWRAGLSPAEDKGLTFYQSPGYVLMNEKLRGNKVSAPDADVKRADAATKGLKSAIAKAPPLEHDTVAYRGFSAGQFGALKAGSVVGDKGFTSVSMTKDQAGAFHAKGGQQALATVTLPKGTRAAGGNVKEMILPPGAQFRVKSVTPGKVLRVELEYVLPGAATVTAAPTMRERARRFASRREPVTAAAAGGTSALRSYWTSGKGADEIKWGMDGSFKRCVSALGKYVGSPQGLCARYHKAATGERPAEKGVQSAVLANPGHSNQKVHGHDGANNVIKTRMQTRGNGRPAARIHKLTIGNMDVEIVDSTMELTPAQVRHITTGLAAGHAAMPLANKKTKIRVLTSEGWSPDRIADPTFPTGTVAYSNALGANNGRFTMALNPKAITGSYEGWHVPASRNVDPLTYYTTHEYGHLQDFRPGRPRAALGEPPAAPSWASSVSRYATTSAHEAQAEAFTEFALTRGATTNDAVQEQARVNGWAQAVTAAVTDAVMSQSPRVLTTDRGALLRIGDGPSGPTYVYERGVVQLPVDDAVLAHPGHGSDKVHGRRGGTDALDAVGAHMETPPQEHLDRYERFMALDRQVSAARMSGNFDLGLTDRWGHERDEIQKLGGGERVGPITHEGRRTIMHADAQARVDYLHSEYGGKTSQHDWEAAVETHWQSMMDAPDTEVTVRVTPKALDAILTSGEFQTKHVTGKGATKNMELRTRDEDALFGGSRPVYGAVEVGGRRAAGVNSDFWEGNDILSQYGKVQVVLKSHMKDRTTITVGDSLDTPLTVPSPMRKVSIRSLSGTPSIEARAPGRDVNAGDRYVTGGMMRSRQGGNPLTFNPRDQGFVQRDYVEAQVHGGVKTSDVAHVIFPSNPTKVMRGRLDMLEISWSVMKATP